MWLVRNLAVAAMTNKLPFKVQRSKERTHEVKRLYLPSVHLEQAKNYRIHAHEKYIILHQLGYFKIFDQSR